MNSLLLTSVLMMQAAAPAPPAAAPAPPAAAPAPPTSAELSKLIVQEVLADKESEPKPEPDEKAAAYSASGKGDTYAQFAQAFEEARVPSCLHPDGLSRQSTSIGPVRLVGLLAAPMVLVAKLRGKCN